MAGGGVAEPSALLGWLMRVACATVMLAVALTAAGSARGQDRPDSFADLAERLLPAVVNISTTTTLGPRDGLGIPEFAPGSPFEEFFEDFFDRQWPGQRPGGPDAPPRRATALGSGFIIDPEGYIVTNFHVIEGADEITVTLHDDRTLPAEIVGRDDKTDIAVLKVNADGPLPFVSFGDSDAMRVGDWVLAIGNPFGLGGTVTAGIISARARDINAGPYDDFIQTDAAINRGNSGGPMFNLAGEVIGINTAIYSPSGGSIGIGFAVPSTLARNVVSQIIEFGETRRGWLGVRIQTVTPEIAESLGMERAHGALVAGVTPGGPADAAGLRPGDVVVEFDGRPIDEMRRLPRLVAETAVEKEVEVVVWRQGELVTVRVVLGQLELAEAGGLLDEGSGPAPQAAEPERLDQLGLTLAPLTAALREQYGLTAESGVVITRVDPGSQAEEKGLVPGTVIVEVGQEPVDTVEDVERRIRAAREAGRRSVLLLVEAGGELRFVALPIEG